MSLAEFGQDEFSPDLLQLFGDHMVHCRQLCIQHTSTGALETAMKYFSSKATPLLRSIYFHAQTYNDNRFLLAPLFPSGAPHLRTAQLEAVHVGTLYLCIPALRFVTSLRLTKILFGILDTTTYGSLRDALMALPHLNHLEVQPCIPFGLMEPGLPIVLPTIQFLHLDATMENQALDVIIHSFHAASLITLSLDGWDNGAHSSLEEPLETHFPSLEHLIIVEIMPGLPDLGQLARKYPDVTWLTCQVATGITGHCDIVHILTSLRIGTRHDGDTESTPSANRERWPKLKVLAVSETNTSLDTVEICNMLSILQHNGERSGLRKLLLPKSLLAQTDADAMGKLREVVEVEDYSADWPTHLAHCC